ncbi:IMP dehydrogenase [Embleya sp. NPDC056575]|uniref:IMP dehydrogenase n=1 Tax=unclassified Embleya TaxID=2699296 RepID=UPI0036C5CE6F
MRHRVGGALADQDRHPLVSAIMEAVSSPRLAVALARTGGMAFIHQNQDIASQAADVAAVKGHKAGFRRAELHIAPTATLGDVTALTCGFAQDLRADYESATRFRHESIDTDKRFRVGAGINSRDHIDRVPALVDAGAGNVVDARAFRYLADAGAAWVKVGIGGGSICTTRESRGFGRGQASALIDVARVRDTYAEQTGVYVPLCCDGGLLSDYHMAIALALGADFVMLGRYFARFDESPNRRVRIGGRLLKEYWGEGSARARNIARYEQGGDDIAFEEGVDGYVPYAGSLQETVPDHRRQTQGYAARRPV